MVEGLHAIERCARSGASPDTHGLNEIGGSVWPRLPLSLRGALFVRSKEIQGQTEPFKGEAIFLNRVIELLGQIDFDKSEIRRENRSVFVCGGPLGEGNAIPPSMREALLRHLPTRHSIANSQIILAERATEALPGSNFTNLLNLEEYISALVDGVILIVESAGSICDLGAFVKTPEIRSKLVVLVSSLHNNRSSFIKLGALRYFEQVSNGEAEISPFHWDIVTGGVHVHDYVLADIVTELGESLKRVRPKGKLRTSDLGDRIYLTLTICHLLRGAKATEIRECYRAIGLFEFESEIVKHLSVLEICNYVVPVSHGRRIKYFVPLIDKLPIRIAFRAGVDDGNRDTLRWIRDISALVLKHEPTRMRIFQEHHNAA